MMQNLTVRCTREFTPKMIEDLMVTFIESGGMISWCSGVKFFKWDPVTNEQKQVKYGETWSLDGESDFYKGRWSIDIKIDDEDQPTQRLGWKKLKWALERPEMQKRTNAIFDGDYDVEDADCIVQMAIFKEIIYG